MESLTPECVLATFDSLVSDGTIIYSPYTTHILEDENYPVRPAPIPQQSQPR
jgi:hypothetical protein